MGAGLQRERSGAARKHVVHTWGPDFNENAVARHGSTSCTRWGRTSTRTQWRGTEARRAHGGAGLQRERSGAARKHVVHTVGPDFNENAVARHGSTSCTRWGRTSTRTQWRGTE